MKQLVDKLATTGNSSFYWLILIASGITLEIAALIYQYWLDYPPCVLCIHVRIWVMLLIMVAIAGLLLRNIRPASIITHISIAVIAAGLLERSWQLLGTERGFIIGDCSFDLGIPAWLALDKWLPSVFEVQTTCGYTPELLFGITMAEALLVFSGVLLIASIVFILTNFSGNTDRA